MPTEPIERGAAYRRFLARLADVRSHGVSLGLDRVRLALDKLGSPERRLRALHIAGTNGKGSTAALTDAILRAAGLRVGLFTSPHLTRFTERIRIDGEEIDGDLLARLDDELLATQIPLTFFEVATVLAFMAFDRAQVDVAVLETGLGGRLDATSACQPVACAITSIALDHENILGNTLASIAYEKACIAKPGVPLFIGPVLPEVDARIAEVARDIGAPVRRALVDYPPAPMAPALPGAHQLGNAALAVALSQQAMQAIGRPLDAAVVARGLGEVRWPGRLERIASDVLLDCAHNVEGAAALSAALPPSSRRVLLTSIVRDKDAAGMLAILSPHFDRVIVTRSHSDRSSAPEELARLIERTRSVDRQVVCVEEPVSALAQARTYAAQASDGLVVVAGSIFLVGALRAYVNAQAGSALGQACDAGDGSEPAMVMAPIVIDASDPLP
jgi:dihydrofolate synthase/folylpolyglutamate synthase